MADLFYDESTKQLAKLLFEVAKELGESALKAFKNKRKGRDNHFNSIASKYIKKFEERFGSIQILGMNEPMSLSNIYVGAMFLDDLESCKRYTKEELNDALLDKLDSDKSLQSPSSRKIDGMDLIKEENKLMVIGAPGGGKTTFLRKIGLECLNSNNEILNKFIPLMIELKNINSNNNIIELMLKELELANFPEPESFLTHSLEKGRMIILFDGLDEVVADLESSSIEDIRNFCDQYSNNKFVVSCRIASYKGGLNQFKNVEISNFDQFQIKNFIFYWFEEKSKNYSSKNVSNECWETINIPEYKSTLELAQSPLLLTLLCLVYHYQQDFPKNRSILYSEAISVLLKEWNAEKRIHCDAIYKEITLPFEELLLANIAHYYFIENQYFFDKRMLKNYISDFVEDNLNAPKYLDGEEILDAISKQQGILVERARNVFSFSHLTFHEFFVARYIEDYGLIDEYVDKYLFEKRWREIFILLCGIMKAGADKLINRITEKIKSIIDDPVFRNLFELSSLDENDDQSDMKLLNFIILLSYSTDYFTYNNQMIPVKSILREINKDLLNDISRKWFFDGKPHLDVHKKLYVEFCEMYKSNRQPISALAHCLQLSDNFKTLQQFKQEFCRQMNVNFRIFSEKEKDKIKLYFDIVSYLYQCKKSAVALSKKNWNRIEVDFFS